MIAFLPNVVVIAAVVAGFATTAVNSAYPERPIRYIVPASPGTGPDIVARILAPELSRQMGQQWVVDNRPGGSGTIGIDMMVRAVPDGYTVCYGTIGTLAINRSVLAKLPYDADRDLVPIVQYTTVPNLLAVTLSLPVKSVAELIGYAKKNPGKLLYASGGNATSPHLSGELLKFMAGIEMVHVPYRGLISARRGSRHRHATRRESSLRMAESARCGRQPRGCGWHCRLASGGSFARITTSTAGS